jgi:hypothetical protein
MADGITVMYSRGVPPGSAYRLDDDVWLAHSERDFADLLSSPVDTGAVAAARPGLTSRSLPYPPSDP